MAFKSKNWARQKSSCSKDSPQITVKNWVKTNLWSAPFCRQAPGHTCSTSICTMVTRLQHVDGFSQWQMSTLAFIFKPVEDRHSPIKSLQHPFEKAPSGSLAFSIHFTRWYNMLHIIVCIDSWITFCQWTAVPSDLYFMFIFCLF